MPWPPNLTTTHVDNIVEPIHASTVNELATAANRSSSGWQSGREDMQINANMAAGQAARTFPLSTIQYDVFNVAATSLGSTASAFQMGLNVAGRIWWLPYGLKNSSLPSSKLLIYDPFKSADPFHDVTAYQLVDLKSVTTGNTYSAYAEGFLGGQTLNGSVYLAPSQTLATDGVTFTSNPVFWKYDSRLGDVTNGAAWSSFNAFASGLIGSLAHCGWSGICNDGRYIYYAPAVDAASNVPHGQAVRYDTTLPFTTASSWQTVLLSTVLNNGCRGFQGCVFDGTYVWFVPSDNTLSGGSEYITRWDTRGTSFTTAGAGWDYTTLTTLGFTNAANCSGFVGGIYADDRYLYLIPFKHGSGGTYHGWITRCDTKHPLVRVGSGTAPLSSTTDAWSTLDLSTLGGVNAKGYQGAIEHAGYMYVVPTYNGTATSVPLARLDLTDPDWKNTLAWEFITATPAMPWQTYAVSDGDRHFYMCPLTELTVGSPASGRIYRFRTPPAFLPGESIRQFGRNTATWVDNNGTLVVGARQAGVTGSSLTVVGPMSGTSLIRSDTTLQAKGGTSTSYYNTPLDITTYFTTTGNAAGGAATVLAALNLPANLLSSNGKGVEWEYWGTTAANTNIKTWTMSFGATVIYTLANAANALRWRLVGRIIRVAPASPGPAVQHTAVSFFLSSGTYQMVDTDTAVDETTILALGITGASTAANDVVLKGGFVRMVNP